MDPCFPLDLEREIFETSALLYPKNIPQLLLVAHRVHTWLEPMLYRVISLTTDDEPILSSFHRKPPHFIRDAVRHVLLDVGPEAAQAVLEVATETRSLVLLGSSQFNFESLYELFPLPNLQRLALSLGNPTNKFLLSDMYTTLTHLDLFHSYWHLDFISSLWHLPALTHLAICHECEITAADHILSNCTRIQVLIHMDPEGEASDESEDEEDREILLDDNRFITMRIGTEEYKRDWEIGAKGGMDFWARADKFVAKRRRGEILPKSRHWILPEDGI